MIAAPLFLALLTPGSPGPAAPAPAVFATPPPVAAPSAALEQPVAAPHQAAASDKASAAAPAGAKPIAADTVRAKLLADEGMTAFDQGDFKSARERFEDAYLLAPASVLLYNLARAAEEAGDAEHALLCYQRFLQLWPTGGDAPEVQRRVRILTAVLRQTAPGRIAVLDAPAGADVYIDDAPAEVPPPEGWTRRPGAYAVKLVTPDGDTFDAAVTVRPGETTAVSWVEPPLSAQAITGWSSLGLGVALFGVSAWTWEQSHAAADRWLVQVEQMQRGDTSLQVLNAKARAARDVDNYGLGSQALWIGGGIALATGAALLLFDDPNSAPSVGLVPVPDGAALGGRF
ncbi:MAG: tetratricopeptide (TPR) repeat protein [Bradymonadia bacterium]|jgi:tetratricopeptide (TPR) repeat protein